MTPGTSNVLLILSGPSGSGKTTLCERLVREESPRVRRVVTATTRPPRPGEVPGRDYHFLSADEFEHERAAGGFYEWAQVHGRHCYGTLRREIASGFAAGQDLVMNIDVQGAESLRRAARDDALLHGRLVTVFVEPENLDQLRERLRHRGQDAADEIERRMRTAPAELAASGEFDHRFVTGDRERDFATLRAIYLHATGRAPCQPPRL